MSHQATELVPCVVLPLTRVHTLFDDGPHSEVGARRSQIPRVLLLVKLPEQMGELILQLSRANGMHSDAASQGGGWWQGCGAAYLSSMPRAVPGRGKFFSGIELSYA